jgi:hypothetical protein
MARFQDDTGRPGESAKMHPVQFRVPHITKTIPKPTHLTLKKDEICSPERSVPIDKTTRCHTPECHNLIVYTRTEDIK